MINYAEWFCGIGGFRLGLEKANFSFQAETQRIWERDKEGVRSGREGSNYEGNPRLDSSSARSIQHPLGSSDRQLDSGEAQATLDGKIAQRDGYLPNIDSGNKRWWGNGQPTFNCVWANDIDKYACQVYRKNFGDRGLVEGDIRSIDADSIADFDLLTAGFPCQSFSLAGKRRGFQDTRGTLFFEIARVVEAKRPKLLLLENVKGLLSNDNGRTFAKIIQTLDELGYNVEWQVLNSKYFGVPQNRERVFIVGHLRERYSREIFPIRTIDESSDQSFGTAQSERSRFRVANSLNCSGSGKERNLIANTISSRYYKDGKENLMMSCLTPDRDVHGVMVANTLDCDGYLRTGARPRDENGKPQLLPIGYRRIRRLTPVECERLQGFPEKWTDNVSDTQRYKLLGNAVSVPVIEYIGRLILQSLT